VVIRFAYKDPGSPATAADYQKGTTSVSAYSSTHDIVEFTPIKYAADGKPVANTAYQIFQATNPDDLAINQGQLLGGTNVGDVNSDIPTTNSIMASHASDGDVYYRVVGYTIDNIAVYYDIIKAPKGVDDCPCEEGECPNSE
jgi:hypothetical protein